MNISKELKLLNGTKIKSLELVKLSDYGLDLLKSGCAVIEVVFPQVKSKNSKENIIKEIKFKNYYTESISIIVKAEDKTSFSKNKWRTLVRNFRMMPNPHYDFKSQNVFTIKSSMFKFPLDINSATNLRFVIRQSSPNWNTFRIENIEFFQKVFHKEKKSLTKIDVNEVTKVTKTQQLDTNQSELQEMCQSVQQMCLLVGQLESVATPSEYRTLNRIEGNNTTYDVNMLNYN